MPETNTARSKKFLEKQGASVWVVEQTVNVPKGNQGERMVFKRDMFNMFDLCGFDGQCIFGVQTTTTSNQSSRIQKVISIPEAQGWIKSGGKIFVHGWKKLKKTSRWTVTITAIEVDKDFGGLRAREITLDDSPLFVNISSQSQEEENGGEEDVETE